MSDGVSSGLLELTVRVEGYMKHKCQASEWLSRLSRSSLLFVSWEGCGRHDWGPCGSWSGAGSTRSGGFQDVAEGGLVNFADGLSSHPEFWTTLSDDTVRN